MPTPKRKPEPLVICTDGFGYFSTGADVEEAYENYCAYHRNIDIRTCIFYDATEIPADQIPQGEDYD